MSQGRESEATKAVFAFRQKSLFITGVRELFRESYMVVDVVQNPQKSNVYEHEKKHVRRDSKMCCCCYCRLCCGAPTTDERIHARTRTP